MEMSCFVRRTIFLDNSPYSPYAATQQCCIAQLILKEHTTMTKAKENIEMINEINSKGYDSFRQLSDITLKAWNTAVDKQIAAYTNLMNSSMEQIKLVSEAKDYQEIVRGQMDLTRKIGEEMVSNTRDAVELSQKTGEEVRAWFESSLSSANEQVSKAVEKAA
jgi:phasin family protein